MDILGDEDRAFVGLFYQQWGIGGLGEEGEEVTCIEKTTLKHIYICKSLSTENK